MANKERIPEFEILSYYPYYEVTEDFDNMLTELVVVVETKEVAVTPIAKEIIKGISSAVRDCVYEIQAQREDDTSAIDILRILLPLNNRRFINKFVLGVSEFIIEKDITVVQEPLHFLADYYYWQQRRDV